MNMSENKQRQDDQEQEHQERDEAAPETEEFDQTPVFEVLYAATRQVGAIIWAVQIENLFEEKGPFGSVGVYIGVRPAHAVLEDLEKFLEADGNEEILDLISELRDPDFLPPWEDPVQ